MTIQRVEKDDEENDDYDNSVNVAAAETPVDSAD